MHPSVRGGAPDSPPRSPWPAAGQVATGRDRLPPPWLGPGPGPAPPACGGSHARLVRAACGVAPSAVRPHGLGQRRGHAPGGAPQPCRAIPASKRHPAGGGPRAASGRPPPGPLHCPPGMPWPASTPYARPGRAVRQRPLHPAAGERTPAARYLPQTSRPSCRPRRPYPRSARGRGAAPDIWGGGARDVDARTSLQQPVHTGAGAGSHRRHQGRDPHIAPHLQPGPVLQQHVNAFNPRVVARHMHERRVAVRVLAVRLGPGLQQDGEAFTAVAQRRVTQCRVAADVSGLQIRSALHQLTNAQRTTARRRLHQRRKLTGHRELAPVWARSRIQEEADAPGVPLIGCQGQRKTRLRVMHTHLRRQQKGKAVVMPVHGGQGERGKSGVCGSGCASVEKSAHTRCVTMGGCFPERTHALRVDRVQGGAVQQQRLEFLQPVHAGGEDQWSGTTHRSN
eukprot:scaffold22_cov107-Isochrysis_galbana.AAC.5